MRVVDSCGWLEHLQGSRLGALYAPVLATIDEVVVPTICLTEVYRALARSSGSLAALEASASMRRGAVVPLDHVLATKAACTGQANKLPLADSIIYATARRHDAELWTHDEHFRGLPGVHFVEPPAV